METHIFIAYTHRMAEAMKANFASKLEVGTPPLKLIACSTNNLERLNGVHQPTAVYVLAGTEFDEEVRECMESLTISDDTPVIFVDEQCNEVDREETQRGGGDNEPKGGDEQPQQ